MAKKNGAKQTKAKKDAATPVKASAEGPYTDRVLQVAILAALVTPWVAASFYLDVDGKQVLERLSSGVNFEKAVSTTSFVNDASFWQLIAVLSIPHVSYFFIWTNADKFYHLTKGVGEPYQNFALLAHLIKMIQGAALAVYFVGAETITSDAFVRTAVSDLRKYMFSLDLFQLILGAELMLLGQSFNYYVYKTIGEAGVYYGCRLGQTIPWVYGFPFSVVPHPQYLGATLSIWGATVLASTEQTIEKGLYGVAFAFTVFYAFSSYVEQNL